VTQYQENGLYCSFEPDVLDLLEDARAFGWDFYKLSEQGNIKFIKFSPETSIDELKSELTKMIAQHNIKRICFDPVSVLALNSSEQGKIRETIFDLIALMKRLNVTSILADESMESEGTGDFREGEWTKTDIIRFLADSVTVFYLSGIAGSSDRAIRVEKMRRTNHIRTPIPMAIAQNGIQLPEQSQ
jgi:KaiC/GvpD/RAD55 family RecA-like ATPase